MKRKLFCTSLAAMLLFVSLGASKCNNSQQDKWSLIFGALNSAPALIQSFGVSGNAAQELTADFVAISTGAQALHEGQDALGSILAALDKLQADGSHLLNGKAAQRITAIVEFLRPFFPKTNGRVAAPTDADVKQLQALMKPIE
jgi:ABC-type transporter Mla subunit MlaD